MRIARPPHHRLLLLSVCLATPVAAPTSSQFASLLKGAGIPAVAKAAKSAWLAGLRPNKATKSGRSSAVPVLTAASQLVDQSSPDQTLLQAIVGDDDADVARSLHIGLLLWLSGLVCVSFLVGRMWFKYSGRFVNWLLRGYLTCCGTSVRLDPLRFVFHDVNVESKILSIVEANGLGGYLPGELKVMRVTQLELALQLVPLLRLLWHLVPRLTRRRSLAWKQEGLDSLEAMQSEQAAAWGTARPLRVRLRGARLVHEATHDLGQWWGGQAKLDEQYAFYYKARYLEQLSALLTSHQLRGDGVGHVEPTGDERAFRVLLRGMLIVSDELQVLYVDPALPGELRLEFGRLEVQMSESADTLVSGLPLLGKVPSQIAARMRKTEMYLGPIREDGKTEMCPGPRRDEYPSRETAKHGKTEKPLCSVCMGASGAAGADGGGAIEEPARHRVSAAHATHETRETTAGLHRRVRGWIAAGGSWVRGMIASAGHRMHLSRDPDEQLGWLEVELKKTPRPDQVKPLQLKVSCPDLRLRVQPMHLTLLGRLQNIYFTYSGVAWERVQQVNESAGFPHNLPAEQQNVVSSLGMPKLLMLLAEQHCDRAMRTDGKLLDEDPKKHPLGELCRADEQLKQVPLHILLYARFLAKCQRPQASVPRKRPHTLLRTLFRSISPPTPKEESGSLAVPGAVSREHFSTIAQVARLASIAQRNDASQRVPIPTRSDSALRRRLSELSAAADFPIESEFSSDSDHKAARLARWEQHGLVAVGITSAPETNGTGADQLTDALHPSLTPPPVPDQEDLNRRGWDLLKRAEGWMLDPPTSKPGAPLDPEAHGMRLHFEFRKAAVTLATDGAGKHCYAGSNTIAEIHLEPQVAEDSQEESCPGLKLALRKSRLESVYEVFIGRLCITDERPQAKEKRPSPEGAVVRPAGPDGKVIGRRISDGSVVTCDLSDGSVPAAGQVIAKSSTLKLDGNTVVGPDGQTLECSTVHGPDGRPLGQLQPDGDRPKHPFREFLAPVVRTRRDTPGSPHKRRNSVPLLPKLAARAVPLLAVKFERLKSAAPAFLLPEHPGQLVVGLDGTGPVGWRNPDGSIVAPGPGGAGGRPGPLLVRNTIVRPDGAVVPVPVGTKLRKDSEGMLQPVIINSADGSELPVIKAQPLGQVQPASQSSRLEVRVSHAAVVMLVDFAAEVSAWCSADAADCVYPRSEVDRNEARRRDERFAQLYPAPSPTPQEPTSMLALGGSPVEYRVTLEDVFIALPDTNPSQKCIKRERGWAFCVGVGGDVSIEGEQLQQEDGGEGDVTAELVVRSTPTEESLTLDGTLRMLTCLMDTVPDGEINLTPAGGHHFMLEPTQAGALQPAAALCAAGCNPMHPGRGPCVQSVQPAAPCGTTGPSISSTKRASTSANRSRRTPRGGRPRGPRGARSARAPRRSSRTCGER